MKQNVAKFSIRNRRTVRNLSFFLLFTLCFSVLSCGQLGSNYPEEVFNKVMLNGNKIPTGFKKHFKEIRGQLKAGSLVIVTKERKVKKANATKYVANHYIHMFDKDIKAIQELDVNAETKPILAAALEMFLYADEIYKTDFPRIAKMIDDGKSDEEIDEAIAELDETKAPIVDEKYTIVYDLTMPYADKHGVKYEIIEMPKPVNYK